MSNAEKATEIVREATKGVRKGSRERMGIVRCTNFRCLGVLGTDGVWRDAHRIPLQVMEVVTKF
jgi:hypothetical protein